METNSCADSSYTNEFRRQVEQGVGIFKIYSITFFRLLAETKISKSGLEMLQFFMELDWDPTMFLKSGRKEAALVKHNRYNYLTIAMERAGLLIAQQLLNVGFEFSTAAANLQYVCEKGDVKSIKLLTEYGIEANKTFYENLLRIVAKNGNVDVIKWLFHELAAEINFNAAIDKLNLLHIACCNDRVEMASLLLQQGANPNLATSSCHPALHYIACYQSREEFIPLLIQYSADVNLIYEVDGCRVRPLHLACRHESINYEAVKGLIKAGAKICRDGRGMSPEDYVHRHLRMLKRQEETSNQYEMLRCEQILTLLATARSEQNAAGSCTLS